MLSLFAANDAGTHMYIGVYICYAAIYIQMCTHTRIVVMHILRSHIYTYVDVYTLCIHILCNHTYTYVVVYMYMYEHRCIRILCSPVYPYVVVYICICVVCICVCTYFV